MRKQKEERMSWRKHKSHKAEIIEVKTLAKKNRMAKEEKASMQKLKRQLKKELNTSFGKAIEKELDRRFRRLYCLRMKS